MAQVAVVGSTGRLGSVVAAGVESADDLELVSRFSSKNALTELEAADVVIDVSTADASRSTLLWLAEHGIDAVVGTTGFTAAEIAAFDEAFRAAGKRCFIVPNFAIGAVLLMKFAAQAAPYFDGVEIIEMHHDRKVDAPSGTARLTASKIAAARTTPWAADPTMSASPEGVRGGVVDGVPVHSVRLRGLVAHEEVMFGGTGQGLTLRHDSYDRSSFVEGALLAARRIHTLEPGVTVGLEAVLDL